MYIRKIREFDSKNRLACLESTNTTNTKQAALENSINVHWNEIKWKSETSLPPCLTRIHHKSHMNHSVHCVQETNRTSIKKQRTWNTSHQFQYFQMVSICGLVVCVVGNTIDTIHCYFLLMFVAFRYLPKIKYEWEEANNIRCAASCLPLSQYKFVFFSDIYSEMYIIRFELWFLYEHKMNMCSGEGRRRRPDLWTLDD